MHQRHIIWAEVDKESLRLTGQVKSHPVDKTFGNWVPLSESNAVMLMNGTKSWQHFACIDGNVVEVPTSIDLNFLTHISSVTWPEITTIDHKWTNIPWLPLDIPKIEPDDWDLFWKLWNEKNVDIMKPARTNAVPGTQFWRGLCCWLNPALANTAGQYSMVDDWSMHFPKMFEQIRNCLPYEVIEKIYLYSNINKVSVHFDPDDVIHPFPNSLRIMLWDTNVRPTFYMTKWPQRTHEFNPSLITAMHGGKYGFSSNLDTEDKRMYVDLPQDTNTFVFNNGAYLHGADLAKPKIIMSVKGRLDIYKWLAALEPSYNKYKDVIPKC